MSNRFTASARKVLARADVEARELHHEYIGTEHILLGLVAEESGSVARALHTFGLDAGRIREEVEKFVQRGPEPISAKKLPLTPRAKLAIEFADEEARNLQQDRVGSEHLILGLLREPEGVAGQVLRNLGLNLEAIRQEVLSVRMAQLKMVERVVRPLRAGTPRKRKMREELLAHLTGIYEEELVRIADPTTAMNEAAKRFGDPSELTREFSGALPASERLRCLSERWFGWRAPESTARYLARMAAHSFVILAVECVLAAMVVVKNLGWNSNTWIALRPLIAMAILLPTAQFSLGMLYFRMRDSLFGVFGSRKSLANALVFSTLFAVVGLTFGLGFSAFAEWGSSRAVNSFFIYCIVALFTAIGTLGLARWEGPTQIRDTLWALLDIAEPADKGGNPRGDSAVEPA